MFTVRLAELIIEQENIKECIAFIHERPDSKEFVNPLSSLIENSLDKKNGNIF